MNERSLSSYKVRKGLYTQKDEKALFANIRRQYDDWLLYSEPKRAMWRLCSAFKAGLQWGVFDRSRHRLVYPEPPSGRINMTVDMIRPWAIDMEAKMTSTQPRPDAIPVWNTTEAKDAAIAAIRLCDHYWDLQKWDLQWALLVRGVLEHGDTFSFLDWGEKAGPKVLEQTFDPNGGQPTTKLVEYGDSTLKLYPAFCVFHDMLPSNMDEKFWFGIASWQSCEDIYNEYKIEVPPEGNVSSKDDHYDAIATMVAGDGSQYRRSKMEGVEGCVVYKWYQRPQEDVPDGFYCHTANSMTLRSGKWPRHLAQMKGNPIVQFSWYRDIMHFYSQGPIEAQIAIQKQINKTESQIIEAKDSMANIKWLVPIGSGVNDISDLSAELIPYIYPYKPEQSQVQSLPAYVFRHSDNMILRLEDIQLLHKASKGMNPAGSRSSLMLSNLQEQDDRPLTVPEKFLEASLSLHFSKLMQISKEMIDTPRMIRYVGDGNQRAAMSFKGTDLNDQTVVSMKIQSGLTRSRVAQTELLLETYRIGGIKNNANQPDSGKLMELMQYAIPNSVFDADNKHRGVAREENALMWQAFDGTVEQAPPVAEWERHDLHLDEHEGEMNSMKWKTAAAQNSTAMQIWMFHREEHIRLMAAALGAQVHAGQPSDTQSQQADSTQQQPQGAA